MNRHDAIEILREVMELDDSMYAYNKAYMDALKMAINTLEQPTVPQWIPCSERLPEKDNLYLITRLFLGEASVNCRFYYTEEFGGHWGTYETGKVIAWCELPEPYQEETT